VAGVRLKTLADWRLDESDCAWKKQRSNEGTGAIQLQRLNTVNRSIKSCSSQTDSERTQPSIRPRRLMTVQRPAAHLIDDDDVSALLTLFIDNSIYRPAHLTHRMCRHVPYLLLLAHLSAQSINQSLTCPPTSTSPVNHSISPTLHQCHRRKNLVAYDCRWLRCLSE